jgi:hypothetical protein
LPSGWRIVWTELDCGSGGCPSRLHVIEPPDSSNDALIRYIDELEGRGWMISESDVSETPYFFGERGNLSLSIQSARHEFLLPARFKTRGCVHVGLSFANLADD